MLLTIADVVLRILRRPIVGTYELVGALTAGLSLPLSSWVRGHIYVDSFVARLPRTPRAILNVVTRLLVLALFLLIGWNLIKHAMDLRSAGEVTPTLRVPFYPVAFGIGLSCLVECLVMLADIVKIVRPGAHEKPNPSRAASCRSRFAFRLPAAGPVPHDLLHFFAARKPGRLQLRTKPRRRSGQARRFPADGFAR
jgi:TRAP-type C4-dicarboxylate transport system permease small subunit